MNIRGKVEVSVKISVPDCSTPAEIRKIMQEEAINRLHLNMGECAGFKGEDKEWDQWEHFNK